MNVYAQGTSGIIGTIQPGPTGLLSFTDVLAWGIQLFFVGAGLVAFFVLLQGAFNWIASGGEEKKLAEARNRMTSAIIGLAMAVVALVGWHFVVGPLLNLYKDGMINLPTIKNVCKANGDTATNANECCSNRIDTATNTCIPQ